MSHIHELRDEVIGGLSVSPPVPDGAYYLFFSIEDYLDGRDYWETIEACLDAGVSVAPGEDFGADYAHYIRICFAGVAPDRLHNGIERLNRVLLG